MEAFDATYNDPATLERINSTSPTAPHSACGSSHLFYQRQADPAPQLRRPDHRTRPGLGTWIGPLSRFLARTREYRPGSQAVNESISSPAPQRPGQLCDRRQPHRARIGLVQPARQLGHRQRIVKASVSSGGWLESRPRTARPPPLCSDSPIGDLDVNQSCCCRVHTRTDFLPVRASVEIENLLLSCANYGRHR